MASKGIKFPTRLERWEEEGRISPAVSALVRAGKLISAAELPERLNSYERDLLTPLFDDALLIQHTRFALDNCSDQKPVPDTYPEAVTMRYAPMLLERFTRQIDGRAQLSENAALRAQLKAAQERETRYRETLEFYADAENYRETWDPFRTGIVNRSTSHQDGGSRARVTLTDQAPSCP